jgi:metal-responsive CopG/Arc/MetJ family transcriptional regulator
MKTAVSIPDPVFEAAEAVAGRLSISRSQLYTRAIQEFLELHGSQDVTDRLDRVYADNPSTLDPGLMDMQRKSLADNPW